MGSPKSIQRVLTLLISNSILVWFVRLFSRIICKDLSRVKTSFKSVPLQFYFEIAGLASAKKWQEIQNVAGEERF